MCKGDSGSGKSSLLTAYTDKTFDVNYIPTGFIRFFVNFSVVSNYDVLISLGKKNLALTIADTNGQEDFVGIRSLSLDGSHVAMVCYSIAEKNSLMNVQSFWKPELEKHDKGLAFLIVGNKSDLYVAGDEKHVQKKEGEKMKKKLKAFSHHWCSAMEFGTSDGNKGDVDKVFQSAIKCGLIAIGEIPKPRSFCTLI